MDGPVLQVGLQIGDARRGDQAAATEALTDDVVDPDVDRDERDLPDVGFQEVDRRVQLGTLRVVTRRMVAGETERLVSPGHPTLLRVSDGIASFGRVATASRLPRGLALAGLEARRDGITEGEV